MHKHKHKIKIKQILRILQIYYNGSVFTGKIE